MRCKQKLQSSLGGPPTCRDRTNTSSWQGWGQVWLQPGRGSKQGCLQGGQGPGWHRCSSGTEWWQDEGHLEDTEPSLTSNEGMGANGRGLGSLPARLFAARRFGASLSPTRDGQDGGPTRTPELHRLWTRVTRTWKTGRQREPPAAPGTPTVTPRPHPH